MLFLSILPELMQALICSVSLDKGYCYHLEFEINTNSYVSDMLLQFTCKRKRKKRKGPVT